MPFNGSGLFVRAYNWVQDKANGILVTASRMDGDSDGFATGLSNCMTRDGQSPATADIPMGGFKLTGLANGVAATDATTVGQVQSLVAAETFFNIGSSGAAVTVNWVTNGSLQGVQLSNNCTITISNATTPGWYYLLVIQDGTGGRSITWVGASYNTGRWLENGFPPTLPKTPLSFSIIAFFWDGSQWFQKNLGTAGRRKNYSVNVGAAGGQSVGATALPIQILLATETVDPYNEVVSSVFTAAVAGMYRVDFLAAFTSGTSTDGTVGVQITAAGDIYTLEKEVAAASGRADFIPLSITASFAAGDSATFYVANSMAAALTMTSQTKVVITRLGDAQ